MSYYSRWLRRNKSRGILEVGNLTTIIRCLLKERMRRVDSCILGLLNKVPFSADLGLVDRYSGNTMWIQRGKVMADW